MSRDKMNSGCVNVLLLTKFIFSLYKELGHPHPVPVRVGSTAAAAALQLVLLRLCWVCYDECLFKPAGRSVLPTKAVSGRVPIGQTEHTVCVSPVDEHHCGSIYPHAHFESIYLIHVGWKLRFWVTFPFHNLDLLANFIILRFDLMWIVHDWHHNKLLYGRLPWLNVICSFYLF